MAFFDSIDVADEHGKLLPIHKMPVEARAALNVAVSPKGYVKVSTKQPVEALNAIAAART